MPRKDKEARLAYQREWYARNSKRVIGKVAKRRHTDYAGVCRNCGGPTTGQSKNDIPEFCAKPACAAEQRNGQRRERINAAVKAWNVRDE